MSFDIKWKSSIGTQCWLDANRVCMDEPARSMVCPNGDMPADSFCQLYSGADTNFPNKCDPNMPATYDHCASNWKACLAEPFWDFCRSFPEMCVNPEDLYHDEHHDDHHDDHHSHPMTHITSRDDMLQRICNANPEKYCPDGHTNPPNMQEVCRDWGEPLANSDAKGVVHLTSLATLCRADI